MGKAPRALHGPVIVEEYIAGTEVLVGILNDRVLGSIEVRPATGFYAGASRRRAPVPEAA